MSNAMQKHTYTSINNIFHHGLVKLLVSNKLQNYFVSWEEFLQAKGIPSRHITNPQIQIKGFMEEVKPEKISK
jgi:hypothetical protein